MKYLRSLGLLVIPLAVAASTFTLQSPASANDGNCAANDFCLYEGTGLRGGRWDNFGAVFNYASGERWWGTSVSLNDSASSTRNRHPQAMALCPNSYGRGTCVVVGGNLEIHDLEDYEMNNKASSNYW